MQEQFALYCPRKGYYTYRDPTEQYPQTSMEVKEARQYNSKEDADRVRMHDQYLYWFQVKKI